MSAPTHLTVRNLSIHPLELVSVERQQGAPTGASTAGWCRFLSTFARAISGLFSDAAHKEKQETAAAAAPSEDFSLPILPFQSHPTDVQLAGPDAHPVAARLTFRVDAHLYQADVSANGRGGTVSGAVRPLDGGPLELTAVYIRAGVLLAVFASPRLEAWMGPLDDDWLLPLLSVPGTHNAPACHPALPSVRCQAVGVPAQLRHGVRFLDVRVSARPDGDALALVHSAFPVSLTGAKYLKDLLDNVYRFLEENRSETVLLCLKREGTGKGTDGQLARHLQRGYVEKKLDRWWTDPTVPNLGQARGKIVLIRRFGLDDDMRKECWDGKGWGIDAQQWPDNCEDGVGGNGCFRIQDFYEISESSIIERKIEYSHGQLERAAEQAVALEKPPRENQVPFFVNFLSGSNFFNASCWPERIAAKANPAVLDYLCISHGEEGKGTKQLKAGSAGTGIVVTDWVGAHGDWDLIKCIVGMNARLQVHQ